MLHYHEVTPARLALHATLGVAGIRCAVATNSISVLSSLEGWVAPQASGGELSLDIIVDGSLSPSGNQAAFRGMNHLVFASFGSDYFAFDLNGKRAVGVVTAERAADRNFWNHVLLPMAIGVLGCTVGVVPMHCACLEWRGEGVLIAGVSGAGKSTLSAAMAERGFVFISDDWTYISDIGEGLRAHGLGARLKLLADTDRFFARLKDCLPGISLNGELAFEMDPAEFLPRTKMRASPKRLLMLQRTESGSHEFDELDGDSVRSFFERSVERLPRNLREAREKRSRVLARVAELPSWKFTYSGSPHAAAETIRDFMEK